MKLTRRYEKMTPEKRPQDLSMDGTGLTFETLAHVPAKWIRFADKDMRQRENLRRIPVLSDHRVIR
jgi:hypothetical protein